MSELTGDDSVQRRRRDDILSAVGTAFGMAVGAGPRVSGVKVARPVAVGSTRPDWRAAIESGGDGGSSSSSGSGGSAVKTLEPATSAKPAAAKSQPDAAAAAAAAPLAAKADAPSESPSSEPPREEPFSLPTVDLVELLSQPAIQSAAFTALSSLSAVLAVLCCIEPEAVLELALPQAIPSDIDVTFVRIIGVTLAAGASVEYSLKVLHGAGRVGFIGHSSGKGLAPPPLEPSPPTNATSWGYAACTALYLLTVAACFAPEALFTGDPPSDITPLVKGVWAPGFLMAAVISYVLKDAADRNRLGASTFKNLNLGLAALEYGYAVIFGSAILSDQVPLESPALSNLAGSLAIATFALYTYATAKK
ncbi:hypothetical protein GPECTOR_9g552 [Gonium pectorale]|uniref:Uncharacterized protein n=1 Tax=Gonium pectorale TaxID=33097 RepID=A0A150GS11_GONPE|nr:hypothetical protein GPECTOR_9g552 [Gonium pectorale]|eukprot:KXZ52508.1 hypothetical protein GPECTOR_9g552 [Gonium pectorale]